MSETILNASSLEDQIKKGILKHNLQIMENGIPQSFGGVFMGLVYPTGKISTLENSSDWEEKNRAVTEEIIIRFEITPTGLEMNNVVGGGELSAKGKSILEESIRQYNKKHEVHTVRG